jgi:dTDP-4-dehydrorhamnose reductase
VPHAELDITSSGDVNVLIEARRPEVVFNCAAYNAVDKAQTDPEAYAVNALGPLHVATACRRAGAAFVHFSTNFVFDGTSDEPYTEADQPEPLSGYAKSKFAGELNALGVAAQFLVIRTAAVYGGARGFPHRILEMARNGRPLRVVSDQTVNPTFARDLAEVAVQLAEGGLGGVVHAVNEGCCGWDELARAALREAGIDAPVESVPTGAYPAAAPRPRNGCLASIRIPPLRPWREALHEHLHP